jgi:hypothetical protein
MPWNWEGLSRNPSITPDFVSDHLDKPWDWDGLSGNSFKKHMEQTKKHKAANLIQKKFLDWFYKPICKDGTFGLNCLLAMKLCK